MKDHMLGRTLAIAGVAGLLMLGSGRADAAVIVLAPSVAGTAGSTGTFDIVLQNTGGAAINIGGFGFGISTTNAGITFTSATTATGATYIFNGDSLFGPDITISSGTSLTASDNPFLASFFAVGAGATVGLGHISYSISGGATPGPFAITLDPGTTLLSDANGASVKIDTLTNGTLNVTLTPEPASLGLFGALALFGGIVAKRRRALQ